MINKRDLTTGLVVVAAIVAVIFAYSASNVGARAMQPPHTSNRAGALGVVSPGPLATGMNVWLIAAATSGGTKSTGTKSGGTSSGGSTQGGDKPPIRLGDYPQNTGDTRNAATAGPTGSTGSTGPIDPSK